MAALYSGFAPATNQLVLDVALKMVVLTLVIAAVNIAFALAF